MRAGWLKVQGSGTDEGRSVRRCPDFVSVHRKFFLPGEIKRGEVLSGLWVMNATLQS